MGNPLGELNSDGGSGIRHLGSGKKVGLLANLRKPDAASHVSRLLVLMQQAGLQASLELDTARAIGRRDGVSQQELAAGNEMLLVLGGDGTILQTVRLLADEVVPLASLNIGHLGFMTTARMDQAEAVVQAIATGNFRLSQRTVLRVDYTDIQGKPSYRFGLNELTLTRGSISRSIHVDITANGVPLNRFSGDGVILATPTGSTAYSLSAGGPLMTPDARAFLVTPICPHTLTSRAIVLPDDVECVLAPVLPSEEILLTVDGGDPVRFRKGSRVVVTRARHTVPLVCLPQSSFYQVLQDKLRWMGSNIQSIPGGDGSGGG